MSDTPFSRTIALIGEDGLMRLKQTHVAVVGLGGVGGSAAMALNRSGIGHITLIDGDVVQMSNLNRQTAARSHRIGMPKADAMAEELSSTMDDVRFTIHNTFVTAENVGELITDDVDYVIDAIDSVKDKIALICHCHERGIRVISATGAGNRLRADQLCYGDLFSTSYDPLCRILRRELRGKVKHHKVVYSKEQPAAQIKGVIASMAFVPNAMGLLLSQAVVLAAAGIQKWEDIT
ncbi:MAG: tRNA threonylcarbamoyladenosine dehydratase [Clostridiales bacterium]|nr:tRNA threonylcarbamoyladenosine dehydratase [Clostridiales bacterium]